MYIYQPFYSNKVSMIVCNSTLNVLPCQSINICIIICQSLSLDIYCIFRSTVYISTKHSINQLCNLQIVISKVKDFSTVNYPVSITISDPTLDLFVASRHIRLTKISSELAHKLNTINNISQDLEVQCIGCIDKHRPQCDLSS